MYDCTLVEIVVDISISVLSLYIDLFLFTFTVGSRGRGPDHRSSPSHPPCLVGGSLTTGTKQPLYLIHLKAVQFTWTKQEVIIYVCRWWWWHSGGDRSWRYVPYWTWKVVTCVVFWLHPSIATLGFLVSSHVLHHDKLTTEDTVLCSGPAVSQVLLQLSFGHVHFTVSALDRSL